MNPIRSLLLAAALGLVASPALAGNFVVTSTGDSGVGTLRWAIEQANMAAGPHRITFNIPGIGVKTIQPLTELPQLFVQVAFDARTQAGYVSIPAVADTPMVELDGSLCGQPECDALRLFGGSTGSSVRGLAIGNFSGYGLLVTFADACTLAACHVGTNAVGNVARPNFIGVQFDSPGMGHVVGGPDAGSRNVISGNTYYGVRIQGQSDVKVQGNYIGTQANGTADFAGGTNSSDGVQIHDSIRILIGGLEPGEGNLISGNAGLGIYINDASGNPSEGHGIYGNKIGTNVYGTAAIPNEWGGMSMIANYTTVGHPSAPNVISGNGPFGLWVGGIGNIVQNNFVGTTFDGVGPLGNSDNGINVSGTDHQVLRNVVGANHSWGIWVGGPEGMPAGTVLRGNAVGTNQSGETDLGNAFGGIHVDGTGIIIGGLSAGDGNIVSRNPVGIGVFGGSGNLLQRNRVYENNSLDVDLGADGITANDKDDPDTGPNNRQNFPTISSVTYTGGQLTVDGSVNTTPNTSVTVDIFSSPSCHISGSGGGETWVAAVTGTTNGNGDLPIHYVGTSANVAGRYFTAMATTGDGTSEFGPCAALAPNTVAVDPIAGGAASLGAPWPHPARGTLHVPFSLSRPAHVALRVYDVAGRQVATLLDGARDAGRYEAEWITQAFAAGVYQVRLEARPEDRSTEVSTATRNVVVVR